MHSGSDTLKETVAHRALRVDAVVAKTAITVELLRTLEALHAARAVLGSGGGTIDPRGTHLIFYLVFT